MTIGDRTPPTNRHRPPSLAEAAGGYKWNDDDYQNRHEGLTTQGWPEAIRSRESLKNTRTSVHERSLRASMSLPQLGRQMDISLNRPQTVPASLGAACGDTARSSRNGRPASCLPTPTGSDRQRGNVTPEPISLSGKLAQTTPPRSNSIGQPQQPTAAFGYHYLAGHGRSNRSSSFKNGAPRGATPLNAKGGPTYETWNQFYGSTSKFAPPPSQAHLIGGKTRTSSNVVFGMSKT